MAVVGQIAIMYNESLPAGQNYFKLQMGKPGTKPSKPILEALSKHQKDHEGEWIGREDVENNQEDVP